MHTPGKTRRAIVLTAAALAIAGGTAITGSGTANAATPADCGIIDIGNPGDITVGVVYAGEVEQEYNTCNGFAFAHFQWSGPFQADYPNDTVRVAIQDNTGHRLWTGPIGVNVKDVDSPGMWIHDSNPDTFQAYAIVNGCFAAWGSWHAYATGANSGEGSAQCVNSA